MEKSNEDIKEFEIDVHNFDDEDHKKDKLKIFISGEIGNIERPSSSWTGHL